MKRCLAWAAILVVLWPVTVFAVQPGEMLKDPALEARARAISAELRCLVCQNQSIDDSDADLAHDLRVLVRQRLQAGDSDEQVKHYLVVRYGDYVLLDPPFKRATFLLWLGPLALLLLAVMSVASFYRRKVPVDRSMPLTPEEKQRLASLIAPNEEKGA